ncbi:MAG: 4-(cytidine 5'-diphospho)-2-C-methyl-D-erythritol kinase [Thermoleophilia bacterium]|nr:4-(cytidine 5'-diphospho)-2-C-methyl-D-erythritol kinase [Thermoleophilia bacterium]
MTARVLAATPAAKLNLALVVGPRRGDGYHAVATVLQRIDLRDRLELEAGPPLEVTGFAGDTIVALALLRLAETAGVEARWRVTLEKGIPVAAGLGGGSADAAAALVLANRTLPAPLPADRLVEIAASVGSDVPFFLEPGPKLAEGRGERLTGLALPLDYRIVVALAGGAAKASTGAVYARFDELGGGAGFEARRDALRAWLPGCVRASDLAGLPGNDLAVAAGGGGGLPELLRAAGAFRADVSGAGPAVYGLFATEPEAMSAAAALPAGTRSWVVAPVS